MAQLSEINAFSLSFSLFVMLVFCACYVTRVIVIHAYAKKLRHQIKSHIDISHEISTIVEELGTSQDVPLHYFKDAFRLLDDQRRIGEEYEALKNCYEPRILIHLYEDSAILRGSVGQFMSLLLCPVSIFSQDALEKESTWPSENELEELLTRAIRNPRMTPELARTITEYPQFVLDLHKTAKNEDTPIEERLRALKKLLHMRLHLYTLAP